MPDEQTIFNHARRIDDPDVRRAYLEQACGADEALRERIGRLLQRDERPDGFLNSPVVAMVDENRPLENLLLDPPCLVPAGTVIGRYKLLEPIGEGGYGTVFMAEQTSPVQRKVALKIIKAGMDTRQVIARFEAERQALALMEHVNIAKVFDAGTTDTGRLYFVMELVKGMPITKYCDEHRLPPRQRLELFMQVCQAVQHAHTKGIIHRDIKPNNVLVAQYDGKPVPKVIDFGVAKATGQQLTERTMFTGFCDVIGTLEYMSPEQAEVNQLDVDTRSDIYSLGVLLYELLTGSTPLENKRVRKAALLEMLRVVREEEPPKPSMRLSTSEQLPSISANRGLEPKKLSGVVRGELDWIVMKSLEKDRGRRYETANGLAMDVQRYLDDEAVQACPPTAAYRFRKFARKHRRALQVAAAFVLLLIATTVFSSWQAVRATRAKASALVQQQRADQQAATAEQITKYLHQLIGSADPDASKGPDYTARALLDDFAGTLDARLADQPEVSAALHGTIGRAYWNLQVLDQAKQHTSRALELRRAVFGTQHEKYADSLVDCALTIEQNAAGFAAGEADLRHALAIYRARGVEGEKVFDALRNLQLVLVWQHKYKEIEAVADEAFAEARKSPVEHPALSGIYHHLGWAKSALGEPAEAEKLLRRSLDIRLRVHGPEHMSRAWGYAVLGEALLRQHKFKEALAAQSQSLATMRRVFAPGHPFIGHPLNGLIDTLVGARDAHALAELFPAPEQLAELELMFREVLATKPRAPADQWDPATSAARGLAQFPSLYLELSNELSTGDRTQEAGEFRQKGSALLDSLQTELAGNPDWLAQLYAAHSRFLMNDGRQEQAKDLRRKLLALKLKNASILDTEAWQLATDAKPVKRDSAMAVELAKKAVELRPQSGGFWNTLGVARYRAGEFKQAVADLEKATRLREGSSEDFFFLAMAHSQLGNKDEARKWYEQAVAWMAKNQFKEEELLRFRTETEELLKITDQKPTTKP